MDISPEVSIPICIEQGSIYHFCIEKINKDGTEYKGERFFIVLNVNPRTDELLILTTITTKIEKQKEYVEKTGEDTQTLVFINKSDFTCLSSDSLVNCNNVYPLSLDLLIKKIKDGGKIFHDKLPKIVIDALVRGVLISKQVPQEYKKKLI